MLTSLPALVKRVWSLRHTRIREAILGSATGVLHLGAHVGQEASSYAKYGLPVLWVEGDPDLYKKLSNNISRYPRQKALLALLGSEDVSQVTFHTASNDGGSSSVYPLEENHGFERVGLEMVASKTLPMKRLDSVLTPATAEGFSHWVVDLQGAELDALTGSGNLLGYCYSLEIEVSLRKIYKGGVQYGELKEFLRQKGFVPLWDPAPGFHGDHFFFRTSAASSF